LNGQFVPRRGRNPADTGTICRDTLLMAAAILIPVIGGSWAIRQASATSCRRRSSVFGLGDNRDDSLEAARRKRLPSPLRELRGGRVMLIYWPKD